LPASDASFMLKTEANPEGLLHSGRLKDEFPNFTD
jgi:hypothetical protein